MNDQPSRVPGPFLLRVHGRANGQPFDFPGQYVEKYEDHPLPAGEVTFTPAPARAKRFSTSREAALFWQQTNKAMPVRPDGKPNRPLTAFSVEIVPYRDVVD